MEFKITLRKTSQKNINRDIADQNIEEIIERGLASKRGTWGWKCVHSITGPMIRGEMKIYHAELVFTKDKETSRDEDQIDEIVKIVCQAAPSHGKWIYVPKTQEVSKPVVKVSFEIEEDETSDQEDHVAEVKAKKPSLIFPEIQTDLKDQFAEIYDRDAQIQIIHSAILAFKTSNKKNKFHTVLYGEPACGKTQILESFVQVVGEETVCKIDATSATKAGVQQMIKDKEFKASILIIEEIEKADDQSLRYLLSLLDHRAEIRKITYREHTVKKVDLLCLATVNDMDLFEKVMSGALASRFSNKLYCPRPSIEILRKILMREVRDINGNDAWIEPTIEYCEKERIRDPRTAITICLCGQDKLLNGTYQQFLKAVSAPERHQV